MSTPREVVLASVRKLKPNKRNVRTHSKKQIQEIVELIRRFGWTYPILVDESWHIIAGHARYQAALYLHLTRVPVIVMAGLSGAEKRALALADNKVPTNAGWDRAALAAELGELARLLPEYDLSIEITGFAPVEIDTLMGDLVDPEQDPLDSPPAIAPTPVSRTGNVWLLGDQRMLCGDARSDTDLGKLMGSERAAMVSTDPPYNVRISSVQGRGRIRHREFLAASGELSRPEFIRFLIAALALAAKHSVDGAIHFVFMDWRHITEVLAAGEKVYSELKNVIAWVKTIPGQGTFYKSQHELIFVFKNGTAPHLNNFELGQHGRTRSNVWTYPGVNTFGRSADLALHPTVKPVALVADAIRDCSRRGDIVLDPFMGSGTTILAAEKVGRRAYGLEIDPLYVDVAVRRWQSHTKRDAIAPSNDSTSLLSFTDAIGRRKARVAASWLDARSFETFIEERRFGEWTRRTAEEPGVALCGVDNALARAGLEDAGFDFIVEAGLGAGPSAFRSLSMHTFPATRRAREMWSRHIGESEAAPETMPAYQRLKAAGMDSCGLTQLASRTVGVPFVGLIAGCLVVSELLRRLHGGTALEFASGSVLALDDLETESIAAEPYAYGHVSLTDATS